MRRMITKKQTTSKGKASTNVRRGVVDFLVSVIVMMFALFLCFVLKIADNTTAYASMLIILAVFLVSRFTHGYIYGILSSFAGVLIVNFCFTYPYYTFNFTLSGYPVFIICMLVVSITTSAMTTQNKLQEEIRIAAEREKTRSNLLRAVSHDLRTPLTSINSVCSVLIENDDAIVPSERKQILIEMRDSAKWLIRMVENLLLITRIDGADAKIAKKQEAVEEIIADAVSKIRKQFPDEKIVVSIPEKLLFVPMDAILIEQVLINLLENAVTHSKTSTEIHLTVDVKEDAAEFCVSDNGVGISKNILPHIFEGCFGRNYEQSSDKKHNMGIGISVCNTIVKAHGGVMSARNLKTGGAAFSFTLPVDKEDENVR